MIQPRQKGWTAMEKKQLLAALFAIGAKSETPKGSETMKIWFWRGGGDSPNHS